MRHFDDVVVETGRQLRATLVTGRGALDDARGLLGKRGRLSKTLGKLERSMGNVESGGRRSESRSDGSVSGYLTT